MSHLYDLLNDSGISDDEECCFADGRHRRRKGRPIARPLNVTLADLYKGKTVKLKITRKIICKPCKGSGGKHGQSSKCGACNGLGRRMTIRMVGPRMPRQCMDDCSKCHGSGSYLADKNKCKTCNGNGTVPEEKMVQIKVTPGMENGHLITLADQGDEKPGIEAGDIIFVIKCEPHGTFTRRGDDLICSKEITMAEALCGHTLVIEQLDGRKLAVETQSGNCIRPDEIRCINGEGMPLIKATVHKKKKNKNQHTGPPVRGNLYIFYKVAFPKKHFLAPEELYKQLADALPRKREIKPLGAEESLDDFDESRYQENEQRRKAFDVDEDDEEKVNFADLGYGCAPQ